MASGYGMISFHTYIAHDVNLFEAHGVQLCHMWQGGLFFTCCPCPLVVTAFSAVLRRNPRLPSGSSKRHVLAY